MNRPVNTRDLGTILCIWAHPDDETWTSAGLILDAIEQGQRVVCITATDGAAGQTCDANRWPQHKLGTIRVQELKCALDSLGVEECYLLGYADGSLHGVDEEEAVHRLDMIARSVCPDTILTFAPDGLTGHLDHRIVCKWSLLLRRRYSNLRVLGAIECKDKYESVGKKFSDKFSVYFATDAPTLIDRADATVCVCLSGDRLDAKLRALSSHASQMSHMARNDTDLRMLREMCAVECFIELTV